MENKTTKILQIDASARLKNSNSRALTSKLAQKLASTYSPATITTRDLNNNLPLLSESMIEAMFTDPSLRTIEHANILEASDNAIKELFGSDVLIIGAPIYNFGIPASLKAYIDLITRSGVTFQYGANGPRGLLQDLSAWIVVTSGGTPLYSQIDHVSGYLKQILGFIGINDLHFIDATQIKTKGEEEIMRKALEQIEQAQPLLNADAGTAA